MEIRCLDGEALTLPNERTALVVIDMQRDFCDPLGQCGVGGADVSPCTAIIPRVVEVVGFARAAGWSVAHTREGHLPDLSDLPEAKRLRSIASGAEIGAAGPLGRHLVRGEYGHDFVEELQPEPGEPVFDKPGFDAFYATGLEDWLIDRNVTHIVFVGVTTECCVQSTLRSAIDRGYYCVTLEDCTAAYHADLHEATFRLITSQGGLMGRAASSDTLLAAARFTPS